MKRGFLTSKGKGKDGARRIARNASETGEPVPFRPDSKFQFSDACRLYSGDPRIIAADHRLSSPSHFFFLPSAENATMVIIDSLSNAKLISLLPLWEKPIPPPPAEPAFAIRESGVHGVGMFATRPIARGELILRERPTFVLNNYLSVHIDQHHAIYESALAGLSSSAQAAVCNLHSSFPETPEMSRMRGIILTNAISVSLPHDSTIRYHGICPRLCRANHSCVPNAHLSHVSETFECKLIAIRPIAEGEEITVSNLDSLSVSRAERREYLQERYKFECHCAACGLPEAEVAKSDTRRAAVAAYLKHMQAQQTVTVARVKDLIKLAERDGMVEEALVLALLGMEYAESANNSPEALGLKAQCMNFIRMLDGNDSNKLVAFAEQMNLSPEQLAKVLDDNTTETLGLNIEGFFKTCWGV
ncbi:hypothetical protein C8F04DRAFT_1003440 [Mycena alexandri]|uniref:SET domain-containing protein n=1 Tax=Mycena alexandri TaxID=1745969 RepID=A0AAD6X2S0_9AGAR|nr:hypothetical protein C8F04DRAFT_1003440 [Mycena alexandri]